MKKICTFFGLLISMCLLLNAGFSSLSVKGAAAGNTEQTSDSNFTNLIVFARFADENEFVNVEAHTVEELKQMIFEGKIQDSKTMAAILAYESKYLHGQNA